MKYLIRLATPNGYLNNKHKAEGLYLIKFKKKSDPAQAGEKCDGHISLLGGEILSAVVDRGQQARRNTTVIAAAMTRQIEEKEVG